MMEKDYENLHIKKVKTSAVGGTSCLDGIRDSIMLSMKEKRDVEYFHGSRKYEIGYEELIEVIRHGGKKCKK